MNATVKPVAAISVINDTSSILAVISRAASDPNVDIDKFERLMQMQERIAATQAQSAFNDAMSDAQSKMGRVSADGNNPQTRSKYATYGALDRAVRPIYTDCGFSLSFDTGDASQAEDMRVLCYVSHKAGHSRTYHIDMPADGKGAKGGDVMTKTHAAGSAASYGMRYLLKMIFNIAVGETDDDGNGATLDPIVTDWIASIQSCATVEDLERRGKELAASSVGGKDRAAIKPAYSARMVALKGAK